MSEKTDSNLVNSCLVELLVDNDCRLSNFGNNKWLCGSLENNTVMYTVYAKRKYSRAKSATVLYNGSDLFIALEFLK